MKRNNVIKNTAMLYGMNIAKLVFPLLTLPYLTRVLSVQSYAAVAYTKSVMSYMQILVDFGFLLSGTKDVVQACQNNQSLGKVTFEILLARIVLSIAAFCALLIMIFFIPILNTNKLFSILSFIPVFLSVFLFDYLFRGIEKMHVIAVRFMVMRGISTLFTFISIKDDSDILIIPLLDIAGSLAAIIFILRELKLLGLTVQDIKLISAFKKLKTSAVYFISNMATTAFGALNTILIGILLQGEKIAYWSVSMQLIGAVQALYTPIADGVYPEMIKSKSARLIKKILLFFMPIVLAGSVFSFLFADSILALAAGKQYVAASTVFRYLIPVLIFSFPAMLLGWPTLGAINKEQQVTKTTVWTAVFQIAGLAILAVTGHFNLISIAVLRCLTELLLLETRAFNCLKFKAQFNR